MSIFVFMKDEEILDMYFWGYELASENKEFPKWFNSHNEKLNCLQGYNDADMNIIRDKKEILELLK